MERNPGKSWRLMFMALFFPEVDAWIDWSEPHEFLDAKLQKLTGDSRLGKRYADRLDRQAALFS
jgi:hypothetical protein